MKLKTFTCALLIAVSLTSCFNRESPVHYVIPQPNVMELTGDEVKVSSISYNTSDTEMRDIAVLFTDRLQMPLDGAGKAIKLTINQALNNPEAYSIKAEKEGVEIEGGGYAGLFYGLLTIKQINHNGLIPIGIIKDAPRFGWRGGMLDVARHFQPVEKIKEYIDMLAYHKMNKFHWHLTDGIGWRIEIEKYPELTRRGAWRVEKHPEAPWVGLTLATADSAGAQGGFYTKEQIREVVEYAKSRYIEVIPEIEMPGHSEAATFCYPQFACVNAQAGSGVYCAGKDETFSYLFDVLDEVAELFASEYIHIGGDEVGKGQWEACPDCQRRMKKEGIKDAHELQSYFVHRISDHLKSKGKKMIGWDEIMEGGLAGDAVVMSWTGWENGIKAASSGHNVVMCPLDYVYLDHYQGYNNFEPQGWGGYNSLKRVYDFPVIPEGLDSKYEQYVLGGQGNLWTENISTWEHIQYMLLPRMAALSEALWSAPGDKNWGFFTEKIEAQFQRYEGRGWGFSQSAYTPIVASTTTGKDGAVRIKLSRELTSEPLYYTLDGSEPTVKAGREYDTVIVAPQRSTVKAATIDHRGVQKGYTLTLSNINSYASGAKVHYGSKYSGDYSGGGDEALVDNKFAVKRGDDKNWQGFEGENMDVTLDLGAIRSVGNVDLRFFQHKGSTSVMLPTDVIVEVSADGKTFKEVARKAVEQVSNFDATIVEVPVAFDTQEVRYVRAKAKNMGDLPAGHPRAGAKAWIFTDEIAVY